MIIGSDFPLIKMQGTGNDFLILDLTDVERQRAFEKRVSPDHRAQWVQKVCHRNFGIGADGFIFLESSETLDFQWDFYNSDGSSAEMCGNAARCVALFALDFKIASSPMSFSSLAGTITAEATSDNAIVINTSNIIADHMRSEAVLGKNIVFQNINTGVPHCVIAEKTGDDLTCNWNRELAHVLRSHPMHGDRGSNVTFYKPLGPDKIESVSFERGVEDFTLACGTGVLAAGFHFCQSKGIDSCHVTVPGGNLTVNFSGKSPQLIGPAKYIAEIRLNLELF